MHSFTVLYLDTDVCFKAHGAARSFCFYSLFFKQDLPVLYTRSLYAGSRIIFLAGTSGVAIEEENATGKCLDDKSFRKLFC